MSSDGRVSSSNQLATSGIMHGSSLFDNSLQHSDSGLLNDCITNRVTSPRIAGLGRRVLSIIRPEQAVTKFVKPATASVWLEFQECILGPLKDGNSWNSGPAPPSPPGTPTAAGGGSQNRQPMGNNPSVGGDGSSNSGRKSGVSGGAIARIIISILVVAALIAFFLSRKYPKSHLQILKRPTTSFLLMFLHRNMQFKHRRMVTHGTYACPPHTSPPGTPTAVGGGSQNLQLRGNNQSTGGGGSSDNGKKSSVGCGAIVIIVISILVVVHVQAFSMADTKTFKTIDAITLKPPPMDHHKSFDEDDFLAIPITPKKATVAPTDAISYSIADLQIATDSFNADNLIGEGSTRRVFCAQFEDGKPSTIPGQISDDFVDIVLDVSRLHHPNVVELFGCCLKLE
ncbi:STRUBBELIG-receptor family 7-like protein isoform X2 [Tanacetum coccineum]